MNIIITGAAGGIGADMVKEFCKAPHNKVLAISRNNEKLEQLKLQCFDQYNNAPDILGLDLCKLPDEQLQKKLNQFDKLDVLINNAGLLINKPFRELSAKDWQDSFEVNLFSVVELVKICLPLLEAADIAHILNISSMGGYQGSSKFPGLSAYSASKAALAVLTECLSVELADTRIRSNCLCLGAVNTDMLSKAFPGYKAPVDSQQMAAYIAGFAIEGHKLMDGKIIPVAMSNPG
jgi:3-oxoacyl-[acyl-carrier protein] reductase